MAEAMAFIEHQEKAHPDRLPRDPIFLMESHDEAYRRWRDAGLKEKILVHLDAHDDLWWIADPASINIGNFICPALQGGIVREVFWVVPDQTWRVAKSLKALRLRLEEIARSYPGKPGPISFGKNELFTTILGKPLRVCPLDQVPRLTEGVLLDIDIDFLAIPCAWDNPPQLPSLPWLWPADLVARLHAAGLQGDMVTIAYSVAGGYTPLKWKYLGNELALRLSCHGPRHQSLQGLELMREAAVLAEMQETAAAEAKYRQSLSLLPDFAAPLFHLAYLYLDMGLTRQAQEFYRQALAIDPSYRTAYNSAGHWYYSHARLGEAEREHRRTLALDPEDAYAHLGLGRIAARRQRWPEAEKWLRKSLELNALFLDAHRTLGKVLARQGRISEAIAAYEKSLLLALKGHQPLTDAIATDYRGLLDPDHFLVHERLARLYDVQGEASKAINGYRMAIAKGGNSIYLRGRLARLYLGQRQWGKFCEEIWQAIRMIPFEVKNAVYQFYRRVAGR